VNPIHIALNEESLFLFYFFYISRRDIFIIVIVLWGKVLICLIFSSFLFLTSLFRILLVWIYDPCILDPCNV